MAEYSRRKRVDRLVVPKRGSHAISRNLSKNEDQDIQWCNRIGCSGRLNPATRKLDKAKDVKSSSGCSAHGKEITGNSSKGVQKVSNPVKPMRALHNNLPSSSEAYSSARTSSTNSSVQIDRKKHQESNETLLTETGSHSAVSNCRTMTKTKRDVSRKPSSVVGSSGTSSGVSNIKSQLPRQEVSTTRIGSRYLRHSSSSDVASSESASSNRKQILKRSSIRETNSSSRDKQPALSSRSSLSRSEIRQPRSAQTSISVNARRSNISTARHPLYMTQSELPTGQRNHRLPNFRSATGYPHQPLSFTHPSTADSSLSQNLTTLTGSYSQPLVDHGGPGHYNLTGITELLRALDRIEPHDRRSFERLLARESDLVLGGLGFYDQHREMRLDIDNMSYEELLALEESMGSVSTALSEEALAKCIKRSVYKPCPSAGGFSEINGHEDDTKCSICQEEYSIGDNMGRLHCKHSYHVDCIDQWLRQRNWCPICKSSAAS